MSWISENDAEFWEGVERRYLEWCDRMEVKPYICLVEGCDRHLPCRKHPPNVGGEDD